MNESNYYLNELVFRAKKMVERNAIKWRKKNCIRAGEMSDVMSTKNRWMPNIIYVICGKGKETITIYLLEQFRVNDDVYINHGSLMESKREHLISIVYRTGCIVCRSANNVIWSNSIIRSTDISQFYRSNKCSI